MNWLVQIYCKYTNGFLPVETGHNSVIIHKRLKKDIFPPVESYMKVDYENRDTIWDDHLNALADPYRRQLLVALMEHNPQNGVDIDPLNAITDTESKAEILRTELVHNHLPHLRMWRISTGVEFVVN